MQQVYKTCIQKITIALFTVIIFSVFSSRAQTLQLVKDINQTSFLSSSFPFDFNVVNGKLFFIAADNSGTYGLWITDGTTAGTIKLTPSTGPLNSLADIIAFNGKVYFSYDDGVHGY